MWRPFYVDIITQFASSLFSQNAFLYNFSIKTCSFWSFLHYKPLPSSTAQLLLQEIKDKIQGAEVELFYRKRTYADSTFADSKRTGTVNAISTLCGNHNMSH